MKAFKIEDWMVTEISIKVDDGGICKFECLFPKFWKLGEGTIIDIVFDQRNSIIRANNQVESLNPPINFISAIINKEGWLETIEGSREHATRMQAMSKQEWDEKGHRGKKF